MSRRDRIHDRFLQGILVVLPGVFLILTSGASVAYSACPTGQAWCDSVISTTPCMMVCPFGDAVFTIVAKDSCGNPVCEPNRIWLDFTGSGARVCAQSEPNWPVVYPDSCNPATGAFFFSPAASVDNCADVGVALYVNGSYCQTFRTKFLDSNGDQCVTAADADFIHGGPCYSYLDFDCDGIISIADIVTLARHGNHCCSCFCPMPGDLNDDHFIDVRDVNALINFTFQNGPTPVADPSCKAPNRGEVNCDGIIDVMDVLYLINNAFSNGPEPCNPCLCPNYPGKCMN